MRMKNTGHATLCGKEDRSRKHSKGHGTGLPWWLSGKESNAGAQVGSLIQEDPTCLEATTPVSHNYLACALEPGAHAPWSPWPAAREATATRSPLTATREGPLVTTARGDARTAQPTKINLLLKKEKDMEQIQPQKLCLGGWKGLPAPILSHNGLQLS